MGKKEDEIEANEAGRDGALKRGDKKKAADYSCELGSLYRHDRDDDNAMAEYEYGRKLAKEAGYPKGQMQALKAIVEMKAEKGDKECLDLLKYYEELAKNDNTEYQLMLYVACFCRLKLYSVDGWSDDSLVKEAHEFAAKSFEILGRGGLDETKMAEGIDSILLRTIDCHRVLAEIAGYEENQSEGELHYEIAVRMSRPLKIQARYEIIKTAYDFPWSNKLDVAKQMCALTDNSRSFGKNVEAHTFLAEAYFERGDVDNAIKALFNVAHEAENPRKTAVSYEDKTRNSELLVFAYKAEKSQKELLECKRKEDQYRLYEKLGDLYNNAGFKNGALLHYERMLKLADTSEEKLAALASCAETSKDLKQYKKASNYFVEVQELEEELDKDTSYTFVNQFLMKLNAETYLDDEDMQIQIGVLKERENKFLYVAYEGVAAYYEKKGMKDEAAKYKELEEQVPSAVLKVLKHLTQKMMRRLTDEEEYAKMLYSMRERAKVVAEKKKLLKAARKKTYFGETKLMEMVRKGNMENVKILVEEEHVNVSQGDGNGWTPLSEAVGANDVRMVRYLLEKGANPNTCTKPNTRSWCGLDFGGKITPLMEACLDGRCEIANCLLDYPKEEVVKAMVIATNKDGWSPRDFIVDFINRFERDEENDEDIDACEELAKRIKQLQDKYRFPERGAPPMPQPISEDTDRWKSIKTRESKRAEARKELKKREQLNVYSSVMVGLRNRHNARRMVESDDEPNVAPSVENSDDEGPKKKKRRKAFKRVTLPNDSDDDEDEEREKPRGDQTTRRKRRRSSAENDELNENNDANCAESDEDMPRRTNRRKRRRVASQSDEDENVEDESEEEIQGESEEDEESSKSDSDNDDDYDAPDEGDNDSDEAPDGPNDVSNKDNENDGGNNDAVDSQSTDDIGPTTKRARNNHNRSRIESDDDENEEETVQQKNDDDEQEEEEAESQEQRQEVRDMRHDIRQERRRRMHRVRNPVPADDATGIAIVHDDEVEEECESEEDLPEGSEELSEDLGDEPNYGSGSAGSSSSGPVAPEQIETREKEPEKSPESSGNPADDAIAQLEADSCSLNLRGGGSTFTEENLTELWGKIKDHVKKKKSENPDWRVQNVQIANIDIPCSALLSIIQMRPRNELSLRYCEIDNEKLQDMLEELEIWSDGLDCQLKSLDLSFNRLSGSSDPLARLATAFRGLHTLNLQGLSGIEKGEQLMKILRELPLKSLNLSENPWVDDDFMTELLKEGEDGQARLSTLKILQISKCAIRSMDWLEAAHGLASLKTLSLAENYAVAEAGWRRVVGFIQSTATTLTSLDVRGTSIRTVMLVPLAIRPTATPLLTVSVSRCNGITPAEICRVFGPLVVDNAQPLKMKLQLEERKIEEVMRASPVIAEKALKVASEAFN